MSGILPFVALGFICYNSSPQVNKHFTFPRTFHLSLFYRIAYLEILVSIGSSQQDSYRGTWCKISKFYRIRYSKYVNFKSL